jgi:hypothetical protein
MPEVVQNHLEDLGRNALTKAFLGPFFGHTCLPPAYGDRENPIDADCCSPSLMSTMNSERSLID